MRKIFSLNKNRNHEYLNFRTFHTFHTSIEKVYISLNYNLIFNLSHFYIMRTYQLKNKHFSHNLRLLSQIFQSKALQSKNSFLYQLYLQYKSKDIDDLSTTDLRNFLSLSDSLIDEISQTIDKSET